MRLVIILLFTVLIGMTSFPSVAGNRNRNRTDTKRRRADVESLSVFIPPPRLVSIVTEALRNVTATSSPVKPSLIVDPLLAFLSDEEAKLLALLLPNLFANNTMPFPNSVPVTTPSTTTTTSTPSSTTTTTTSNPKTSSIEIPELLRHDVNITNSDPLLDWLFNGTKTEVTTQTPVTPGPLLDITDDMLISMLKQAVSSFTTGALLTTPITTQMPETHRPVAIGDDLLAMLLKALQAQTARPIPIGNPETVDSKSSDEILNTTTEATTAATSDILQHLLTNPPEKAFWPENVKPGGGISDEAIAAIIKDVNDINKNISTNIGLPFDDTNDAPVTMSADHVAQLIHDVQVAANTSTPVTSMEDVGKNGTAKNNKTKTSTDKSKVKTKGNKKPGRGGGKNGSKNSNKPPSKKPARRPSGTKGTRRPNVWERLVKAASNAIFGEPKPKPGLFQVEDILDLLAHL